MIVYLLRHGIPEGGRMYRGNLFDDPLTKEGWDQMKSSVQNLYFDYIATSPMKRCAEFADYISKESKIPCLILEDFKEIGFGEWQGKSPDEIGRDVVLRFKKNPLKNPIENAESIYEFSKRVLVEFNKITQLPPSNKNVLLVAHAGVIRVILSYYKKNPIEEMFNINVRNGELIKLELE